MNIYQVIKPRVPRRALLFVAAVVWTIAGSILLLKGMKLLLNSRGNHFLSVILGSALGGLLFYGVVFSKISRKHTRRIINLKNEYPCLFSFFNLKSYIMMSVMITSGIILRTSGILAPIYLTILYLTMGIPLFLSAFRFYYYGFFYKAAMNLKMNTGIL